MDRRILSALKSFDQEQLQAFLSEVANAINPMPVDGAATIPGDVQPQHAANPQIGAGMSPQQAPIQTPDPMAIIRRSWLSKPPQGMLAR